MTKLSCCGKQTQELFSHIKEQEVIIISVELIKIINGRNVRSRYDTVMFFAGIRTRCCAEFYVQYPLISFAEMHKIVEMSPLNVTFAIYIQEGVSSLHDFLSMLILLKDKFVP